MNNKKQLSDEEINTSWNNNVDPRLVEILDNEIPSEALITNQVILVSENFLSC